MQVLNWRAIGARLMPWNSPRNPLGIVPLWAWLAAIVLVALGVLALAW